MGQSHMNRNIIIIICSVFFFNTTTECMIARFIKRVSSSLTSNQAITPLTQTDNEQQKLAMAAYVAAKSKSDDLKTSSTKVIASPRVPSWNVSE